MLAARALVGGPVARLPAAARARVLSDEFVQCWHAEEECSSAGGHGAGHGMALREQQEGCAHADDGCARQDGEAGGPTSRCDN